MPYHRQTNNFKKFFSLKNSAVLFFVVIILVTETINPGLIKKPFQSASLSLYFVKNDIENHIKDVFSLLISKEQLSEENRNLTESYATLSTFCASSIVSLKNNQVELEKSLGRRAVSLKNHLGTAYVIAKPPITSYGSVIIDLGAQSGIKAGNKVLVGEYIVGIVSEVEKDKSTVKLYGEKGENVSLLVGTNRLTLTGIGKGLGTFESGTANESKIALGENVWLYDYPEYLFGTVVLITQSSANQYQTLTIKTPVNVFELSSVDIISN